MLDFVTIPSPTAMLSSVGTYSDSIFQALLPWGEFAVGIVVGCLLVGFLSRWVVANMYKWINSFASSHSWARSNPLLTKADHWSFRHSPEGRRYIEDMKS